MTPRALRSSTAFLCAALLGIAGGVAAAQPVPAPPAIEVPASMLTDVDDDPDGRGVVRTAMISLPADLFEDPPPQDDPPGVVRIPIGDNTFVELEETRRRVRDGKTLIVGRDRTQDHSSFMFVREGNSLLRGEIQRMDELITFTGPQATNGNVVFKMVIWRPSDLPDEHEPNEASVPTYDAGDPSGGRIQRYALMDTRPEPSDPVEIDLMVVYTPMAAAMASAATGEPIADTIDWFAWHAGMRIEDQTGIKLNLVHVQQVDYTEEANMAIDLQRLECPCDHMLDDVGDNHLNEVFAPWKAKQADVVSLWIHSADEAGYGNLMSNVNVGWAPRAAHVVAWDTAVANKSFDHELGHQFGARHDWSADWTNNQPYPFNHGYVNLDANQVTIMAYTSSCGSYLLCTRRGIWSDPDYAPVGSWGTASGAYAANNARTLETSAPTVSQFDTKHNLVGCCNKEGGFLFTEYRPGPCPP